MAAHWLSLGGFLARIVGQRHLDRNDVDIELKNKSWTVARGSADRQKILVNLETPRIKRFIYQTVDSEKGARQHPPAPRALNLYGQSAKLRHCIAGQNTNDWNLENGIPESAFRQKRNRLAAHVHLIPPCVSAHNRGCSQALCSGFKQCCVQDFWIFVMPERHIELALTIHTVKPLKHVLFRKSVRAAALENDRNALCNRHHYEYNV